MQVNGGAVGENEKPKKRGSLVDNSIYIVLAIFGCVVIPFLKTTFEFKVVICEIFKQ